MAQLIIHAGFPKCGSSSVFQSLKKNLPTLLDHKTLVFNRELRLPRDSAQLQSPIRRIRSAMGSKTEAKAVRGRLREAMRSAGKNQRLILASETLANPQAPNRLLRGIDTLCDVTVVFYIRPQVDWIPSAWKQWDMKLGRSISQSFSRYMVNGHPAYQTAIDAWAKALPRAKIILRPFIRSEMVMNDPARDFFDVLGIPQDEIVDTGQSTNPSIDYALLHLMMQHHSLFFADRHDGKYLHRMTVELPKVYLKTNAPMLTTKHCNRIAERFRTENLALIQTYLKTDDPKAYLKTHFEKKASPSSTAYIAMAEADIQKRAENILGDVFGLQGTGEDLALALKTYLESPRPS